MMKMNLLLFLLLLPLLCGCVQIIAPAAESAPQGELLIQPIKQTPSSDDSGLKIISTPESVIQRPTIVPTSQSFFPTVVYATATPNNSVPYVQPVNTVCERMRFVEDVTIPDNTMLLPGQTFRKVWRIQNAGSCAWNGGYQLIFAGGHAMGTTMAINLPRSVAPGETVDLSIDLTAPSAAGIYTSHWKMLSPSGNVFGTARSDDSSIWTTIVVEGSQNIATWAPHVTPMNTGCSLVSVNPAYRQAFKRGEETDFSFTVRNQSNIAWDTDNMDIAFVGGENMLKRKERTRFDLPYSVNPGSNLTYTLDAIVPSDPGTYTMTMGIVRGYEVLCSMDVTVTVVY